MTRMERFRVEAGAVAAARARAAALGASASAPGLAARASAGEALADEELGALLLSPHVSTEALLAIAAARRTRVRDAARQRTAPGGRACRAARHHVHLPGDLQPGGLRTLHGGEPREPAQRLRAPAHELRPRPRRRHVGREPGGAARPES